jgi:hypothetical protein
MQELISFQDSLLASTPDTWSRGYLELLLEPHQQLQQQVQQEVQQERSLSLQQELPKQAPNGGIIGLSGTGKTTLLLQYLRCILREHKQGIYVSADHPYFYTHSLLEVALHAERYGLDVLLIDNLHAYPNPEGEWEIIRHRCPHLQVLFAQSGGYRPIQAPSFLLPGLSFREYLAYHHGVSLPVVSLDELSADHLSITTALVKDLKILPLFRKYLQGGYFPGSDSGSVSTLRRLNQIFDGVMGPQHQLDAEDLELIKRLLGEISTRLPYEPNISQLARQFFLGRQTITTYMKQMELAGLVHLVSKRGKGVQKPDKIYLDNLPFTHLLAPTASDALLRETFLLNQLRYAGHAVSLTDDEQHFLVDDTIVIEVVGRDQPRFQHMESTQAYLAQDDIEHGFAQVIPLWVFGMLY